MERRQSDVVMNGSAQEIGSWAGRCAGGPMPVAEWYAVFCRVASDSEFQSVAPKAKSHRFHSFGIGVKRERLAVKKVGVVGFTTCRGRKCEGCQLLPQAFVRGGIGGQHSAVQRRQQRSEERRV